MNITNNACNVHIKYNNILVKELFSGKKMGFFTKSLRFATTLISTILSRSHGGSIVATITGDTYIKVRRHSELSRVIRKASDGHVEN